MDEMRGGDVLPAGTRLEEFEIERELGAGGFGVTYLAHDTSLDRQVAIKEYLPQAWGTRWPDGGVGPRLATHAENYRRGRERFLEEARVLARLRHPNVLQVHRVIEKRGTAYMVTEYVEGRSLEAALRTEGPWPESRVLALLDALTAGLEPVHAAGLVHRDISPENVMLRGDGSPVLIDFSGFGADDLDPEHWPRYAPIEQYSTKDRGPWTDVYALGAVAYAALGGRVPEAPERTGNDGGDTWRPVAEVSAHGVSPGFAAAIGAALALRGSDRPQSLAEWRSRLGLPAAGGTADMPGGAAAGPRAPVPPAPDSGPAGPRMHPASRSRPVTHQTSRPGGAFDGPAVAGGVGQETRRRHEVTMDEMRGGYVLPAGTRLEEFEIERELGEDGFGVTYLAHDRSLDRQVAIKEYLPHDWATRWPGGAVGPWSVTHAESYRWGLERFWEEARVLARLHHPHVVQVYRVIEARGTAYMVTEYVEGRSLAEALRAEGPWPEARVLALLDELTAGLGPVHAAGLVHRDIKPANVMLRGDGSPVLINFYAARQMVGRQSRPVTAILTPGYAPLEQYNTKGKQGPWTDVYALGAVAYEALSGRVPEEATARMEDDTLPPVAGVAAHGVNPGCAAAIGAALALRGPDRPQSLAEWRSRLGLPAAGGAADTPGGAATGPRAPAPDSGPAGPRTHPASRSRPVRPG